MGLRCACDFMKTTALCFMRRFMQPMRSVPMPLKGSQSSSCRRPGMGLAEQALIDGAVDVLWAGPMRVMKHHDMNPGSELVCFAEIVCRDPFSIVGGRPNPDFRLADLAAMRLATVSEVPTPWLCLQEDLRQAGVDPERLDRVGDRSMAENLESMKEGRVDAAQLFEPFVEEALASKPVTSGTRQARAAAPPIRLLLRRGIGSPPLPSPCCAWSERSSGPSNGSTCNLRRRSRRQSGRFSRSLIALYWRARSPDTRPSRSGDATRFFPRTALIACGEGWFRAGSSAGQSTMLHASTTVSPGKSLPSARDRTQ